MVTIYCDYKPNQIKLLEKYISPSSETSAFKGIPINLYDEVTRMLPMKKRRIIYRGTSKSVKGLQPPQWFRKAWYKRPQSFCHKFAADTFAIYYNYDLVIFLGRP